MTLHRLFIANRGEIACRIIQTAKRLGYTTIVPVSDVDEASRAARLADVVVPIGGDTPASSYLDQDKLLNAMEVSQADSLHPGYGFRRECGLRSKSRSRRLQLGWTNAGCHRMDGR